MDVMYIWIYKRLQLMILDKQNLAADHKSYPVQTITRHFLLQPVPFRLLALFFVV